MAIYKGKVERVRNNHVEGWVAGSSPSPELVLHIDDKVVATALAQSPESGGRGTFRIAIPAELRDGGIHKIMVSVKDAPGFLNAIPLVVVIDSEGAPDPSEVTPEPVASSAPPANIEKTAVEPVPIDEPAAAESSDLAPSVPLRRPGRGVPVHMPVHMSGFMDGVKDNLVHGWITDRNQPGPVELALYIDGRPVTTTLASIFREDVQSSGVSDGYSGFRFDIPVDYRDDQLHRLEVRLASEPAQALFPPVLAAIAPTVSGPEPAVENVPAAQAPAAPEPTLVEPVSLHMPAHMSGSLDGLGDSYVYGWITDRDRPGPVELALRIDGRLVTVLSASLFREDVRSGGVSDGYSGFQFDIPVVYWDSQPHHVEVCLASDPERAVFPPLTAVIAPPPEPEPEPQPEPEPVAEPDPEPVAENVSAALTDQPRMPVHMSGSLDGLGDGYVYGWIIDRNRLGPVELALRIDGSVVTTLPASVFREDVLSGGVSDGNSGFQLDIPVAYWDNQPHQVEVCLASDPERAVFAPLTAIIAPPPEPEQVAEPEPVTPEAPVEQVVVEAEAPPAATHALPDPPRMPAHMSGSLDGLGDSYVYGWITDRERPGPVELALRIDGNLVTTLPASVFREDVRSGGVSDGYSGFQFDIPVMYWDNQPHLVEVCLASDPDRFLFPPLTAVIATPPEPVVEPEPVAEPEPEPESAAPVPVAPLPDEAPAPLAPRIDGTLDGLKETYIYGWITDHDAPGPVALALNIDGLLVTTALAARFREDVLAGGVSDGYSGFHFDIPVDYWDGRPHRLDVRLVSEPDLVVFPPVFVIIAPSDSASQLEDDPEPDVPDADVPDTGSADIGAADIAAPPEAVTEAVEPSSAEPDGKTEDSVGPDDGHMPAHISGFMDGLTQTYIYGWIADRNRLGAVELTMHIDGHHVTTALATLFRPDVQSGGHCGFHFDIPVEYWDNRLHRVDIRLAYDPDLMVFPPLFVIIAPPLPPSDEPIAPIHLKVEHMAPDGVSGWMVNTERKDQVAEADVYVDGIRFTTLAADRYREDLITAGLVEHGGGFQFTPFNPGGSRLVRIQFAPKGTQDFIATDRDTVEFEQGAPTPVSNAYPHLLQATGHEIAVIRLPQQDLAQAIADAGRADIVLVESGVETYPGWLSGLRAAAYSDPRAATATPLCNNAGVFSVPEPDIDNFLPPDLTAQDMARLVRQASGIAYPRCPVGGDFCLFMRRDALDQVGFDGDIQAFCLRAIRSGRIHVLDDRTYVYRPDMPAEPAADLDTVYPEATGLMQVFSQSEGVLGVRWRLRRALAVGKRVKPRILYVISTRTGGTPQTNRDLMQAVEATYEPWVLACDSRQIELSRFVEGREIRVARVPLATPIQPTLHRSPDYDDAVASLLLQYAFELVHIRHLGWHGADLPVVCKRLGIPVVFSLHDFYTVCPTIKLLDQDKVYCAGTCTATAGDCAVELWPQSEFPPLKNAFVHRWREIFADALAACDAFVTTSPSARDVFLSVYPDIRARPFPIIPHGRHFARVTQSATRPAAGQRLRVLVPGNISPAKGADLINAMIELDIDQSIEWHLLGDPGKVTRAPNVVVHFRYQRDDFTSKVAAIAPHVGAVLSIWPETWCHTLTEMWSCGLPVVGIDCGAVGERIKQTGGGWLLPLSITPRAALDRLLSLRDGSEWEHRTAEVLTWQTGYGETHDIQYMGAAYEALYRDLLSPAEN